MGVGSSQLVSSINDKNFSKQKNTENKLKSKNKQ
jgi:hypothetical protein